MTPGRHLDTLVDDRSNPSNPVVIAAVSPRVGAAVEWLTAVVSETTKKLFTSPERPHDVNLRNACPASPGTSAQCQPPANRLSAIEHWASA